ncbi:MAG: hypothetical protein JST31_06465 [Actinobacteria bacterium]|nr:hypothetical protein [Actinomycetota bacterium]
MRRGRRPIGARRAAAVAGLALAAAVVLPAGGAAAESGECEWRPHQVRVVKHVKRHGKRVRVVRKRVRWSCVPVAATAPGGEVPATPPAPPPAPPGPTPPEEELSNPHWLGAQAYEFKFEPTKERFEISAGTDTIELINRGQDAHDLHLESLATHATLIAVSPTASGGHNRGTALLEAGEYRLFCSLADHAEKGMERILVVTP